MKRCFFPLLGILFFLSACSDGKIGFRVITTYEVYKKTADCEQLPPEGGSTANEVKDIINESIEK